jgi:hypothetical protein
MRFVAPTRVRSVVGWVVCGTGLLAGGWFLYGEGLDRAEKWVSVSGVLIQIVGMCVSISVALAGLRLAHRGTAPVTSPARADAGTSEAEPTHDHGGSYTVDRSPGSAFGSHSRADTTINYRE